MVFECITALYLLFDVEELQKLCVKQSLSLLSFFPPALSFLIMKRKKSFKMFNEDESLLVFVIFQSKEPLAAAK